MRRYWMALPALAAIAAVGAFNVNAQPPQGRKGPPGAEGKGQPGEGRRGQPGQPGDRRGEQPGEGRRGPGEWQVDPQVEAWVKMLAEKITDPHDEIRDSARAALVTVGHPAIGMLKSLESGSDGAKATAARKLINAIETMHPRAPVATARGDTPSPGAPRGEGRPGFPGPGAGPNPFETAINELGLNDKERKTVEDIHETLRAKMREMMEQVQAGTLTREKSREIRKEIHENMMKSMKEALKEEQFAKFEEIMKKVGRPGGPDGPRPPE